MIKNCLIGGRGGKASPPNEAHTLMTYIQYNTVFYRMTETTWDAEVKPRMYILIPAAQRKALGGIRVGEIVSVTIRKLEEKDAFPEG